MKLCPDPTQPLPNKTVICRAAGQTVAAIYCTLQELTNALQLLRWGIRHFCVTESGYNCYVLVYMYGYILIQLRNTEIFFIVVYYSSVNLSLVKYLFRVENTS